MNELSLHILDICQNSIKASATLIEIIINENILDNTFEIIIRDNGVGMNEKTLSQVSDPFFTTRTTRKVGLGVSLYKMACEMTDGQFEIKSEEGAGTSITANFTHDHIDRAPLGEIDETLAILIMNENNIDIYYKHTFNKKVYIFDTREVKQVLDDIPITDYNVILWIKDNIKVGLEDIQKEEAE